MKKQETSTKTKVPVKHSIRTKLVLATICMVFMIIAGGVCLNLMFMEKYYTEPVNTADRYRRDYIDSIQEYTRHLLKTAAKNNRICKS